MCAIPATYYCREDWRGVFEGLRRRVGSSLIRLDIALDWVRLSELSGKTLPQVQGLARCQEGYFTQPERALSVVDRCTAKGIEDGILYWYPLIKTSKKFAAQRRIIAKQNDINRIVKQLWAAMIRANGQPTEVTVHSKVVSIPKGLFYPHPEGIMIDHPSTLQKLPIELTHPVQHPQAKPHPPVLGAKPSTPQYLLFQKYLKELEHSDPAFQRSLSEDPQYKCQNNRVYTYHETVKGSLARCEGVLEFEQKAITILSEADPTLEELEFLNRVLFDIMQSCEVTKYALQEQNNPSLVRYTSLAHSQPLEHQILVGSGTTQPLLI